MLRVTAGFNMHANSRDAGAYVQRLSWCPNLDSFYAKRCSRTTARCWDLMPDYVEYGAWLDAEIH